MNTLAKATIYLVKSDHQRQCMSCADGFKRTAANGIRQLVYYIFLSSPHFLDVLEVVLSVLTQEARIVFPCLFLFEPVIYQDDVNNQYTICRNLKKEKVLTEKTSQQHPVNHDI